MQFERETTPAHALNIIASPWTKSFGGAWGEAPENERFMSAQN